MFLRKFTENTLDESKHAKDKSHGLPHNVYIIVVDVDQNRSRILCWDIVQNTAQVCKCHARDFIKQPSYL